MLEDMLAGLAKAGGSAIVAAMATDAWQTAKSRVTRLLGRGDERREHSVEEALDEDAALLEGAGTDIDLARAELAPVWGRRLAMLLEENPGVAGELRELVERLRADLPTVQQSWLQQYNTATAGGTVIAHQGPGGQHIYYDRDLRSIREQGGTADRQDNSR
jgi:hypothetical protein